MEWVEFAICKGSNTDDYYPERRNAHAAELAKLCYCCPVIVPCRAHSIKHELFGVWGGMNARERITERRILGITITNVEMPVLRRLAQQRRRKEEADQMEQKLKETDTAVVSLLCEAAAEVEK